MSKFVRPRSVLEFRDTRYRTLRYDEIINKLRPQVRSGMCVCAQTRRLRWMWSPLKGLGHAGEQRTPRSAAWRRLARRAATSTVPWSRGRSRAIRQRTLPCDHDARVRGRCRGCTGCPRSALSHTRIAAHRTARRASRHRESHVALCSFECLD